MSSTTGAECIGLRAYALTVLRTMHTLTMNQYVGWLALESGLVV
jgi:hypothetical protein